MGTKTPQCVREVYTWKYEQHLDEHALSGFLCSERLQCLSIICGKICCGIHHVQLQYACDNNDTRPNTTDTACGEFTQKLMRKSGCFCSTF